MPEITCAIIEDLLDAYLDGEVSEETKRLLEEHIHACSKCRARVAGRRRVLEDLKGLKAAAEQVSTPAGPPPARSPDGVVLDQARKRLRAQARRRWARILAGILLVAVVAWYAITPARAGLYLPKFAVGQLVVAPKSTDPVVNLPLLWVQAWPGQPLPDLRALVVQFADGKRVQWNIAGVMHQGVSPWPLRYRRWTALLWRGDDLPEVEPIGNGPGYFISGVSKGPAIWDEGDVPDTPFVSHKAESLTLTGRGNAVITYSEATNLNVVQMNVPLSSDAVLEVRCSAGSRFGGKVRGQPDLVRQLVLYLESTSTEEAKLVDVVLPAEAYPLSLILDDESTVPLELPYTIPPGRSIRVGTSITGDKYQGQVGITPVYVFEIGGVTRYVAPFYIWFDLSGSLECLYDLTPEGSGRP